MAHQAQWEFFSKVKGRFPGHFHKTRVLECGSLDVNGSLRGFCAYPKSYLGIDIRRGNGVDIVTATHHLNAPDEYFDLVMSAEMLEHDEFWARSVMRMVDVLRHGGLLVLSMATTGRAEHGTLACPDLGTPYEGIWGTSANYYRNLTEADLTAILVPKDTFSSYRFEVNEEHHDLYFWGIKR